MLLTITIVFIIIGSSCSSYRLGYKKGLSEGAKKTIDILEKEGHITIEEEDDS